MLWVFFEEVVCTLGVSPIWYQGNLKATGSGVLEDLTFRISEGWLRQPRQEGRLRTTSILVRAFLRSSNTPET